MTMVVMTVLIDDPAEYQIMICLMTVVFRIILTNIKKLAMISMMVPHALSSSTVAGPHQSTRSTKVRLSHLNPWPSSSSLAYSGSASERHLRYATCEMRSVIVICVSNRHQRPCVYPSINHGVTVTSIAIVRECTRRCLKNTGPCHLSLRLHGIP